MTAVANHDITHIADTFAIHEYTSNPDRCRFMSAVRVQLEYVAILENETVFCRQADILGEPTMAHQMAILAMDRHEITRPSELNHGLQLFLTSVTGDMDLRNFLVVKFSAASVKMVNQIRNGLFVARYELR